MIYIYRFIDWITSLFTKKVPAQISETDWRSFVKGFRIELLRGEQKRQAFSQIMSYRNSRV
jgi:hypothetical protein